MSEIVQSTIPSQLSDARKEFILAEFAAMRDEIELHLGTMNKITQLAVAASAAIFVFELTQFSKPSFSNFVIPISAGPFFLSAVCCYHYYSLLNIIRMIAAYLRTVEDEILGKAAVVGWQHYLAANDHRRRGVRNSRRVFWFCLLGFDLCFGIYLIVVAHK